MSKKACGLFRQFFAVCCAHSLCAVGAQLVHLQPEKYFVSGTRPDTKCFRLCFSLTRKILRSFFNSLTAPAEAGAVLQSQGFQKPPDFFSVFQHDGFCMLGLADPGVIADTVTFVEIPDEFQMIPIQPLYAASGHIRAYFAQIVKIPADSTP